MYNGNGTKKLVKRHKGYKKGNKKNTQKGETREQKRLKKGTEC